MAALYFTWTGWTQGSPDSQRATHFHWETHFLCMHLSHTGTLKTSANYTNTEGRLSKFDLNSELFMPTSVVLERWDVEVWMCGVCLTKRRPLLRHQVSRTEALSSEQQGSKEWSPLNVTGEIKGDFHHLCKVLLVYYNLPTHTHPHYNLFTSWKYMGSHRGGGVWSSNLCS